MEIKFTLDEELAKKIEAAQEPKDNNVVFLHASPELEDFYEEDEFITKEEFDEGMWDLSRNFFVINNALYELNDRLIDLEDEIEKIKKEWIKCWNY